MVTPFYQATIRLTVRGSSGQEQEIETVIDTGFDGALTLPLVDITALGLPWRRRGRALLADCPIIIYIVLELVMATLIIHDFPDTLLERLQTVAQQKGLSLEQEIRDLLETQYADRAIIMARIQQRWETLPTTLADEANTWRSTGRP